MDTAPFDPVGDTPAQPPPRARLAWRLWPETLKGRVAAGALAALFAGMGMTAWHMGAVAERDLLARTQVREQQETSSTAALIGRRVAEMQRALRVVTGQIEPAMVGDPRRMAQFFEQQPVLREMFANVFAARPDGQVVVVVDSAGPRHPNLSVADRGYFRRTVAEGRALVSEPISGRVSNEPIIMFSQPVVRDAKLIAVIGGSLRLASRDLLADLAESRDEDDTTLIIITDDQGRILAHPQHARLLESLATEPSLAASFALWREADRPMLRNAGAWSTDTVLVAMTADATTGWHVWRASPRNSVLAPLHGARRQALLSGGVAAFLLAAALVAFLALQLRPLAQLERRAAALLKGDTSDDWPDARGEIGDLTRTLRHVWAERTQMEKLNTQVLQKLASVMAASPVGLIFTRHQRFELVSAECCRLLGRREDELVGQLTQLIFASNEDYLNLGPKVGAAFGAGESYVGEWPLLRADGVVFWARLRARPVDSAEPGAGTIWSVNDVTEQMQSQRQLEHDALHDPLTGALNRKGFEQVASAVFFGGAQARPSTLLMMDLDRFKPINDIAGHGGGDAMLKAVTQAISAHVRTTDHVARLGGDEFAVLLPGCDQQRALAVAEKVRLAIDQLALTWDDHTLRVGMSIGVAEIAMAHQSLDEWTRAADSACYEAKRGGRNMVKVAGAVPPLRVVDTRR